jgi:hypothetical protein
MLLYQTLTQTLTLLVTTRNRIISVMSLGPSLNRTQIAQDFNICLSKTTVPGTLLQYPPKLEVLELSRFSLRKRIEGNGLSTESHAPGFCVCTHTARQLLISKLRPNQL